MRPARQAAQCASSAPSPPRQVTSSSFAAIFPTWPYLLLSVVSTIFCAAILAETFYTERDSPLIKLYGRQFGVQSLALIVLWAWVLPALRVRLRSCASDGCEGCVAVEGTGGRAITQKRKRARRMTLERFVSLLKRAPDREHVQLEYRNNLVRSVRPDGAPDGL